MFSSKGILEKRKNKISTIEGKEMHSVVRRKGILTREERQKVRMPLSKRNFWVTSAHGIERKIIMKYKELGCLSLQTGLLVNLFYGTSG